MLTSSILFAVLCFLGLLLFFSGLPNITYCSLPPDSSEAFSSSGKKKIEILLVIGITAAYAFFAFWNLGKTSSPQTFVSMAGKTITIEIEEEQRISQIALFPGVGAGNYQIEYSADKEGWFPLQSFSQDHVAVLKWAFLSSEVETPIRYLRIICTSGTPWLGEISLNNSEGRPLTFQSSEILLCDEQDMVPECSNYYNSSYFDEIYHVRTAWEHLHGIWPYEISHPPLGKELISLGILLFGMTPFGWRFSGTLAGIMMIPLMYLFVKTLFRSGRIAVLSCILLASGFMHYVQTRIATVDSFAVLFILCMFLFMYRWVTQENCRDLALCGLFFGLGTACKWTGLYAGAGLAVIWLVHWIHKIIRNGKASSFDLLKNAVLCIVFFVIVPVIIYFLSYIPYGKASGIPLFSRNFVDMVLENQKFMFQYHSSVVAEHPYSSRWYQWVLNIRPILYYLEYLPDGKRISIAAFVNPVICWGGLFCIPILLYLFFVRRDHISGFLLAAYFSGLIPWMFISRLTFEYHYFASAVFLIPAICYVFYLMEINTRKGRVMTACFAIVSVLVFAFFFPVLNGMPIDNILGTRLLGWLPSWPI